MNMKCSRILACILLAMLFLESCSPQGFPYGKYKSDDGYILTMKEDGTYQVSADGPVAVSTGTYTAQGNEVTWETDSFCEELGKGKATYTWTLEKDILIFTVKGEDPCSDRQNTLDNIEFRLQK